MYIDMQKTMDILKQILSGIVGGGTLITASNIEIWMQGAEYYVKFASLFFAASLSFLLCVYWTLRILKRKK